MLVVLDWSVIDTCGYSVPCR